MSVYCQFTIVDQTVMSEFFNVREFIDSFDFVNTTSEIFLIKITEIGLESKNPLENCSARQILLENDITCAKMFKYLFKKYEINTTCPNLLIIEVHFSSVTHITL